MGDLHDPLSILMLLLDAMHTNDTLGFREGDTMPQFSILIAVGSKVAVSKLQLHTHNCLKD